MSDGYDILDTLTSAVRDRLLKGASFDQPPAVEVYTERLSDLRNKINIQIQSKLGLAVVVHTPEVTVGDTGDVLVAKVSVQIYESITANQASAGTRITAQVASLRSYVALMGWMPPGGWSPMQPIVGTPVIRLISGATIEDPFLTYEVAMQTVAVLTFEPIIPTPLSGTP